MKKVVMYLMNQKGYTVLKSFLKFFDSKNIEYVVSAEDKNIKKDYYSEIKDLCRKSNVNFYDRKDKIPNFDGYKFAIGWRWIIQNNKNLIVFHDSILPKYRGFAPLVNSLINGEEQIGVTALFASEDYDKGDIIAQEKIIITYPIKIKEAISLITPLYSKLVNEIFEKIKRNEKIPRRKQNEYEATYSLWRDEKDYKINWNDSAKKIKRLIDAVGFPYNGAYTFLNGKKIIVNEVELIDDLKIENRDAGKVIFFKAGYPAVVCGQGILLIKDASYIENNESILPLKKFRSRFGDE